MDVRDDVSIPCPHCGEAFTICVETRFSSCEMIEDCAVCCRPIQLLIRCEDGEIVSLDAFPA